MITNSQQPLAKLSGISSELAEKLRKQNLFSCIDLLFLLPIHYQDRSHISPIADLRYGKKAQIQGRIQSASTSFGRRPSLSCILSDNTGSIVLRFYYFNRQQKASLTHGKTLRCYGEVRAGKNGLEIYHPKYTIIDAGKHYPLPEKLQSNYPKIEGLGPSRLKQLINKTLTEIQKETIDDPLLRHGLEDTSITQALAFVHQPPLEASIELLEAKQHPMQLRLARDELVAQRLSFLKIRKSYQLGKAYQCANKAGTLRKKLLSSLSFEPTPDQSIVEQEIYADLDSSTPMMRLLQGDVGSGKTLVALLSAIRVIENGQQCALMAPTELLAEQHYQQAMSWLSPLGIDIAYISGKSGAAEKRRNLQYTASGQALLVIGTHAIIQQSVEFKSLVLSIIDEQHRFGVHQRLALRNKGKDGYDSPHQLIMTATPIPRTLAMSLYADLDVSTITQLPPGRKPIETRLVNNNRREKLIERVRSYCKQGQQVYWVCPLVEDSEKVNGESAEQTYQLLCQQIPDLSIGMVHGRLDAKSKQSTMQSFRDGNIQLLVATTVIEVGVDVPNASVMVIENAERLGLAQLHQLRGRIGRGSKQSYCLLLYQEPVSQIARERLQVMHQSQSGFDIAEKDLQIRGPGEMLGAKQAGAMQMRIADLQLHQSQFQRVKEQADILIQDHQAVTTLLNRWFPNHESYLSA